MNIKTLVSLLVFGVIAHAGPGDDYEAWVRTRLTLFEKELFPRALHGSQQFPRIKYYIAYESVQLVSATPPTLQGNDSTISFVCTYEARANTIKIRDVDPDIEIKTSVEGSIKISLNEVDDEKIYSRRRPDTKFEEPGTALRGVLDVHRVAVLQKVCSSGPPEEYRSPNDLQLVATAEFGNQLHAKYKSGDEYYYGRYSIELNNDLKITPILE